jgi:hypothetical protein
MAPRHRELFLLQQLKGVRGRKVRFGEAPKPAGEARAPPKPPSRYFPFPLYQRSSCAAGVAEQGYLVSEMLFAVVHTHPDSVLALRIVFSICLAIRAAERVLYFPN